MTTRPLPTKQEAVPVGAILFVRSIDEDVAPDDLGGQSVTEQERIVCDRVVRDGLALNGILYVACPDGVDSDERLSLMLAALDNVPVQRLYISGAVYAHDSDDEVVKHYAMLRLAGVRLTICTEA